MRQKADEPEGFDTLWRLWLPYARHTDGRGKARPTYMKWLQAGADPQDMIDGAQWHVRSMPEKDRPYINLLSVYLNSERWADECEKERDYQKRLAERESNVVPMTAPVSTYKPKFLREYEARKQAAE